MLPDLFPYMPSQERLLDIFAFSLLYSGIVFTSVLVLMLTAWPKSFVDWAFTVRETALVLLFLLTGALLLYPSISAQYYRLIASVTLDIAATVLVVALIRAHVNWRKANKITGIDIPHVYPKHRAHIETAGEVDESRHPENRGIQRREAN